MRVIVVGASGTIGKAVVNELGDRHDIVKVGRQRGDLTVDISDPNSIMSMYTEIGSFDALVCAAGHVHFGPFMDFTQEQWQLGLNHKLMGQVNLVMMGMDHINDRGSFTLTSGILGDEPIEFGASASMVNGALQGFVMSAAIEMPRGIRINLVSPTVIEEALPDYGPFFRGFDAVSAAKAALGYAKSVEGRRTGQVIRINGCVV
ncbi:MAG: short chain dehydrogenase [Acidobacteria bacterium]|nr:short chain dehydrogenase [Acidobacteriota bacterium]